MKRILFIMLSLLPMMAMAQWEKIEIPIPKQKRDRSQILNTLVGNMVRVDGGAYQINDKTRLKVSTFYIGKYEVTQEEWWAVMGEVPFTFYFCAKNPVVNVSWHDCQEFIQKLNSLTGLYFRMPTEAEWEFAAQGGKRSRGYYYAGSDMLETVAWYNANSLGKIHKVGQKQPNELGLFDMSGNVEEWCYNWNGPFSSRIIPSNKNPTGPLTGSERILRGGQINYGELLCRVGFRSGCEPENATSYRGLRLVLSDKPDKFNVQVENFRSENALRMTPPEEEIRLNEVYVNVFDKSFIEEMPYFPGGQVALMSWLGSNIKYPVYAEENGVQGRVVCSFVVEKDGSITDIKVVRGVDPSLDKEAVRVLKQMPKWIPGTQNGTPVKVKFTMPVTFHLTK